VLGCRATSLAGVLALVKWAAYAERAGPSGDVGMLLEIAERDLGAIAAAR